MKKFTLLVLTCIASLNIQPVTGQTFTLSNYTPITVISDPWLDVESHVYVTNSSSNAKQVRVDRFLNVLATGHSEFFCFGSGSTGLCYPPNTDFSNGNDTILGNSTDQSFKATVRPLGNFGYTSIHYRFSDTNNPGDSVGVDLGWDFTTSINENQQIFGISKPLQNPADAFTVFSFNLQNNDLNDKLVVFNMLGSKVKSMDVPGVSGALVLTTSDLKAGVYMVSYISNGKVKDSCRLVVSHR
ncbi:MAG: T9SS type A sorting domain-containing protein [Bacteroidetes bacterium]|nr:T9SS type A sorting domain-containing protein [Bacteroidota bacterium]